MTSRLIPLPETPKINGKSMKWWSRRKEAIGYVKAGGIFFREEDISRYFNAHYFPPADPGELLDKIMGSKRPRKGSRAQASGANDAK